jgi:8-oxo-dGTP diphosphatase
VRCETANLFRPAPGHAQPSWWLDNLPTPLRRRFRLEFGAGRTFIPNARGSPHRSAYPGLWSFPGGHIEQPETLVEALVREVSEEVGVTPTSFAFISSISDPNTSETDPATYHMYRVTAWEGGQPALRGDKYTELRWFTPEAAITLPDLALEEYRPLFKDMMNR